MAQATLKSRRRLSIQGLVQGVGFRPFVCRLAQQFGLTGWVSNDPQGVYLEVQGAPDLIEEFQFSLSQQAPPAARIQHISWESSECLDEEGFHIRSSRQGPGRTLVSPDLAICPECLQEMSDPDDRRFHYPFINCTGCGPRMTIITAVPYDRAVTTMAGFRLCPACQLEYQSPTDRRFHAQPNACPECGPSLSWYGPAFKLEGPEALNRAVQELVDGSVVAVKGIGGYHLACDAFNPQSVARLRQLKGRPHQPLAMMARSLSSLRKIAQISEAEANWLGSQTAPILLLRSQTPGRIGAMLPYSGLHQLLLQQGPEYLVMTSANRTGEPICFQSPEELAGLCDGVLDHNRPIQVSCDDSVGFVFQERQVVIRRGRGLTPSPLRLPFQVPPTLGLGGDLKSAFCLAQGDSAILSQHLGDLTSLASLQRLETNLQHFQRLFRIEPRLLAVDLHPGYLGRSWAEGLNLPTLAIQHHHAHLASLMGEHTLARHESLAGFVFDGTGFGEDGKIWGGELLLGGYDGFRRLAHLSEMPLIGGDQAVRHPYRQALATLWHYGLDPDGLIQVDPLESQNLQLLWQAQQYTPSTSMGRLFDVVSCLCGLCRSVSFEGQAALALEQSVDESEAGFYDWEPTWHLGALLERILKDLRAGCAREKVSARFHRTLAEAMARTIAELGADRVGLSGGVFQNRTLLEMSIKAFKRRKIQVLYHLQVPCNDGGLAFGQALIAGARGQHLCA